MPTVWFSHLGEEPLKSIKMLEVEGNTISSIISNIEKACSGFKKVIYRNETEEAFDVSTRVLFRPLVGKDAIGADALFIGPQTVPIESPEDDRVIGPDDHILFSILNPERFKAFIEEGLMERQLSFHAPEGSNPMRKDLRSFLRNEHLAFRSEKILGFTLGEAPFQDLVQEPGKPPVFNYKGYEENIFEKFDRKVSRVVPKRLADAIKTIWDKFNDENRLRLFQEDAFFFILAKLSGIKELPNHLLISAPTGGGKTEAFLFPILARILFKKEGFLVDAWPGESPPEEIQSIVMYPTKALANDQTKRLVELLYHINRDRPDNQLVTLGVLTGDTPRNEYQLKSEPVIQICPACGHADLEFKQDEQELFYIHCKTPDCPSPIHKYCRLTSKDIVAHPPDILITNPDTVSVSLQSPVRRKLFKEPIESVVFDEIHLYEGIFGCNVSHLLRRLEEAMGQVPLYLGLSATIENAKQLAALMFNEAPEEILYLSHTDERPYQYDDDSNRVRYHALARPAPYQSIIRSTLNTAMAISHAFTDPANRKSLVFANKTADVDRLVTFMDEAENKYFRMVAQSVAAKVAADEALNASELEALAEVWQWLTYLEERASPFYGAVFPGWHRGALEKRQRLEAINRFMSLKPIETGEEPEFPIDVMFATKTLELGIDIGTVSTVMNCSAPFSNNEYFQRVGRGGRRGNSLALTILNDVGAIDAWFASKFDSIIESPEFEGIPLIVTNRIITRQHVVGRILDHLADTLVGSRDFEVQVRHLREWTLHDPQSGREVGLEQDPEAFARGLFERLFREIAVRNGGDQSTSIERLEDWFQHEARVLQITPSAIDAAQIRSWLLEKCKELREHGDPSKTDKYWESNKSLSNYFNTVDRDLLTPLRGDGQAVSIYTKGRNEDQFVEDYTRIRATRTMPPGAYTRQGMNSFIVESPVKKEDEKTAEALVDLFWDEKPLLDYYQGIFGESFPKNQRELRHLSGRIVVPEELMVRHSPYRFYCDNPRCHRTYTHHEVDENLICSGCGRRLKQLTQLFLCTQCGELMEPPVPKVCINPRCIQRKMEKDPDFLVKIRSHHTYYNPGKPLFRFISLAKQNWKCVDCGVVFNFYDYHLGMWNDRRLREIQDIVQSGEYFKKWDLETPVGIALKFLFYPEYYKRQKDYEKMGYRPAMFKHYSRHGGCDAKVRQINVPTVTSIQHRYYKRGRDLDAALRDSINVEIFELQVADMAKEYTRAFDKGTSHHHRERVYLYREIFDNKYWANLFDTHAFSIDFGERIEAFLNSKDAPKACVENSCSPGCQYLESLDEDVRQIYSPKLSIEEWQLDQGQPRKPDPRAMWCENAGEDICQASCERCDYYSQNKEALREKYLKYVILHTLKHAIMWALPKYVGINLQGLNGQLYPNQNNLREDPFQGDILIMDSAESGSGAMLMVKNNWERIWSFARDVLELTREGRGNLNLPYSCFRFNNDLCPHIALSFTNYLDGLKK